jgi:predicted nuclease of predicted toxin-antitoxin system
MRFLIDMQLSPALAVWLQHKGNDAKHAYSAGLGRASDEEILEAARKEDRIVITAKSLVVIDKKRIRKRRLPINRIQN